MIEGGSHTIETIPEEFGRLEVVIDRHAEPEVYEKTGAGLSERGERQAAESGLRTFCLIRYGTFPSLHNQAQMPQAGFPNDHELVKPLIAGLRNATPRVPEEVLPDRDIELTVEQGTTLYNQGVRTLVLPYGSDRKRCMDTWEVTKKTLSSLIEDFLAPEEAEKIYIHPYCRDPRFSSANTLDVMSYIGFTEKSQLLPAWLLLEDNEELEKLAREKLGCRTPSDVLNEFAGFLREKSNTYLPLLHMGMNIVLKNTTHETQFEAFYENPHPIGFSSASYFRLLDFGTQASGFTVNTAWTPYLNEQAQQ